MVCSVGSGRMAVMLRLLAGGSVSQTIGEEIGQQKLYSQCIFTEIHEADEANLLDEKDMHVFGLRPMTDPLDLVCCNACKKPVQTSQYAVHAELCRSLISAEETTLELNGGSTGHRRPPRKERKKSLTSYINQATPVTEQERFVSTDAYDMARSVSHMEGQPGMLSSFSMDTKRNLGCVDLASIMDGKGVSAENTDRSTCVMPPPAKRSKLISSQHHLTLSSHPEAASDLTKIMNSQENFARRDFQLPSTSGCDMPNYCVSRLPGKPNEHILQSRDVPVPLATKIYYSQRNNRLRSAIAHMYYEASAGGQYTNVMSPEVSQDTLIRSQASSRSGYLREQVDDVLKKRESSACKPDEVLAQSSEVCLEKTGGYTPPTNFSHQFPVDNLRKPKSASVELLRSKYLSEPYSFAGNSGQSLGNMQQQNGSVPVLLESS